MEPVIKFLVLYLKKKYLLSVFFFICGLYLLSINAEAGLLLRSNLEIVDSLVQKVVEEIPLRENSSLCILSPDSSQVAYFVKNSFISGLVGRKFRVYSKNIDECSTIVSFVIMELSVTYRELKEKSRFSTGNYQRSVVLDLNVSTIQKDGEIKFNKKFTKSSIDTISVSKIRIAEQKGRIIGKGIFVRNKKHFAWIEPVVSVFVITLIGSLFYWVRSN